MFRSNPYIDRFFSFFSLPKYFIDLTRSKEHVPSKIRTAIDLVTLFFSYRTFPNHYRPCRLWEVDKSDWKFYFGSNYQSHQKYRLIRTIQPYAYQILFSNKLISYRLCRDIGVPVPHTYGLIEPRQNFSDMIMDWFRESGTDRLFIKPLLGAGGRDAAVAIKDGNNVIVKTRSGRIPLPQYRLKESMVVQEVIRQDARMAAFSPASVNTLRIVTMITKKDDTIVIAAIMRNGVGDSHVDNWSAGGIGIGIDLINGALMEYGYDKKGNKYKKHPITGIEYGGFKIPRWEQLVQIALKVQESFPYFRLLGMDLTLRENAEPVLIEINDYPDLLGMEQMCGPLFKNEKILRVFGEYGLLINRHQRKLYDKLLEKTSLL